MRLALLFAKRRQRVFFLPIIRHGGNGTLCWVSYCMWSCLTLTVNALFLHGLHLCWRVIWSNMHFIRFKNCCASGKACCMMGSKGSPLVSDAIYYCIILHTSFVDQSCDFLLSA